MTKQESIVERINELFQLNKEILSVEAITEIQEAFDKEDINVAYVIFNELTKEYGSIAQMQFLRVFLNIDLKEAKELWWREIKPIQCV